MCKITNIHLFTISTISLLIGSLVAISCLCSVSLLKRQNEISVRKKDIQTDIVILIIFIAIWVFILGGYAKLIKFTGFTFIEKCIIVLRALAAGVSEEVMFRMVLYLLLMGNKQLAKFPILTYFIIYEPFHNVAFFRRYCNGRTSSVKFRIFSISVQFLLFFLKLSKKEAC